MKKEFLVLGKKGCPYTVKMIKYLDEHRDNYTKKIYYTNIDFQEKEFKEKFGKSATYPRVYIVKKNGKMEFMGGADDTIKKLKG